MKENLQTLRTWGDYKNWLKEFSDSGLWHLNGMLFDELKRRKIVPEMTDEQTQSILDVIPEFKCPHSGSEH